MKLTDNEPKGIAYYLASCFGLFSCNKSLDGESTIVPVREKTPQQLLEELSADTQLTEEQKLNRWRHEFG